MKKIFSQIEPETLISIVYTRKEFAEQEGRAFGLTPDETALQALAMKAGAKDDFPAHKHLPQDRETHTTHESFIFIEGEGKVVLYDIDNAPLEEVAMGAGDVIILLAGGHKLITLKDSLIYMFKNGPYQGHAKDKEVIE